MTHHWRTIDFRPAPPGWHIVHLTDEDLYRHALPGWLIQEDDGGDRRVVIGGVDEDGEVRPALIGLWNVSAWYVAGPDDPDPTREEVEQERARRRGEAAKAAERRSSAT
ncbi:hypothetical protein AB0873_09560 [Micromonospora sp. NPDC047707]|uniref:hypothetical protein n=1 Tax=Micromonospora sp. NPDC047707 TaxID=3154498 RepID=UPI003453272A